MKRMFAALIIGTGLAVVVVIFLYLLNDGEPPKGDLSWFELGGIMWLIGIGIA